MSTLHCRVTRTGYKLTLYAGRQLQQVQLSCCDVSGSRTSAGLQALSNRALPVEGRPVANILLCPCCVCVLSGSFNVLLHPCLHIDRTCRLESAHHHIACLHNTFTAYHSHNSASSSLYSQFL